MPRSLLFSIIIFISSSFICADERKDQEIYEEYALSNNRSEVLKKLIPGTEIYYFLHTLHLQQTGKIKEAAAMIEKWEEVLPSSNQVETMKNCQALLTFETSSDVTYQFLKKKLDLNFEHIKPLSLDAPFYETSLDAETYNFDVTMQDLLFNNNDLESFTQLGLYQISTKKLKSEQLQNLLNQYSYNDLPNMVDLVLADFQNDPNRSFGDLTTHLKLTQKQMNELIKKKPNLLTEEKFVNTYLLKLNANLPANFANKPLLVKKHLLDCWAYVKELNPSFNSLKANILFSYLTVCLELNQPDNNLFLEYLKLPRNAFYANNEFYQKANHTNAFIQFDKEFSNISYIPIIRSDSKLIETYLFGLIKSSANMSSYQNYFEKSYFNKLEAETKIKTGLGKPEDFYQILGSSELENLKNSVEVSFTEQNAKFHLTNDAIKLFLQIKNINELEIQVFKLNMLDYYRSKNSEIDHNVSLEGYIPNFTKKISYKFPSYIRHEEMVELTEITKPGVYVIELLGNGIKTRTFIQKGAIYPAVYESNNGHEIQLFDDSQNQILNFTVYFGKHELHSDDKGVILIPYTDKNNTGAKKLIFSHQEIVCLHQFNHKQEGYDFSNLILNSLESFIPNQNAKILFKPCLKQNDKPVSLDGVKKIIADVALYNNANEKISSQSFKFDKLMEIYEADIFIPESATKIEFLISALTTSKFNGEDLQLNSRNEIVLSGATAQSNILGMYFRKQKDNYQIECLNKAGMPQANVCLLISLYHQYLTKPFQVTLQSDQKGIIQLGALKGIRLVEAKDSNLLTSRWYVNSGFITSRPGELVALQNNNLEIPVDTVNAKNIKESFLLLMQEGGNILEDLTDELKIENEMLKIPTNSVGEFILYDKKNFGSLRVLILNGKKQNKYYVAEDKISDITSYLPHQIVLESIDDKNNLIKGKILNTHKSMKAYMWTGRYIGYSPDFCFGNNDLFEWPSYQRPLTLKFNQYFESIKLSSEQKYIIDRKDIKKFPGNLLPMPSTLLNPWDTSLADSFDGSGLGGGSFGTRSGGGKRRAVMRGGGSMATKSEIYNNSLEFLPNSKIVEINVQKDGLFEVDIKDFKDQCDLEFGVISPYGFTIKELALTPSKNTLIDNRQTKNDPVLNDKLPTTSMVVVQPDKQATFLLGADKEVFKIDSLSKLKSTLDRFVNHQQFNDFYFLEIWNSLSEDQKLLNYKKYACHELHFYLYQKDQKFFNAQIKPFLKNKQKKSFIDQWLLDEDLSAYLGINQFNQLNLFEKILLAKRQVSIKNKVQSLISEYLEVNKPNIENNIKSMDMLLNSVQHENEPQITTESASDESPKQIKSLVEAKKEVISDDAIVDVVDLSESEKNTENFYRDLDATKEYAEANYYHLERRNESTDMIQPSQFWLDYLNNTKPIFVSENILSFTNIHEGLLALALIDLPEIAVESTTEINSNQMTIKTKAPMIVLLKSFKVGTFKAGALSLKQHYFYQLSGKKEIMPVEKPFLINKQYGCLTVITNTTSEVKEFYFNYLIPEGALPLNATLKKQLSYISIQPYTSKIMEHYFFFPAKGAYSHLPGKAVDLENIFTNEKVYPLNATADQEALDKNSWEFVVKEGNKEKTLEYIKTHNLLKINLSDIYYMTKDQAFFEAITNELRTKYYFDSTIWSYSVYHKDKIRLLEFIPNTSLLNSCGVYFESPLLSIDPIQKRHYEHKEYFPLIKSRAHPMGLENQFENVQFEMHYRQFIQLLMYKPKINNSDLLNLVIYTLNQQRISEALQYFAMIKENEIVEKLQYDYLKAYLAFYQEDLKTSEMILAKYKDIAIPQWKEKFDELSIQLNEIKTGQIDSNSRKNKFSATVLADKEANIVASNQQGNIKIDFKNLSQCRVDYYQTDLEILFSNAPFEVMKNQFQFLTVPNFSETLSLKNDASTQMLAIPENLKNKNLVIKISGAGKESTVNYNPNQMDITISGNYGELRIVSADVKKPLSGIYVKVYGEKNGGSDFIKDGYSDLRGIFDYISVSGKPIKQYSKIAILIISEKHGAAIYYTTPPAQ